jgi:hypothetical protein
VSALRFRHGGGVGVRGRIGVFRGTAVLMFLFCLPPMMMMPLGPLVHFVLQDRRWDPRRVIED